MRKILFLSAIPFMLISCNLQENKNLSIASSTIDEEKLADYVSVLGSDEFMGRKPFTKGEELTTDYLEVQFKRIGLEPAFDGSFFQDVQLVEIQSDVHSPVEIATQAEVFYIDFPDEIAVNSKQLSDKIEVKHSELVFAGFGIVAPEYNWKDYQNLDVKGKTVVVLVNDPGLYTGDKNFFKGKSMTYYGRWTYKYEEAERQGADGVIIIHEDLGAGYPWDIPRKSALGSEFYLNKKNQEQGLLFNGWISAPAAEKWFAAMGYKVDSMRQAATMPDFHGFSLDADISLQMNNKFEYNISKNVAGVIRGSKKPDENIIYSAHWDHFGIGEPENGDSIYNGAVDNGTSLAWMMGIAEAYMNLPEKPERSIIFLAPTAEEQGLLGSKWYSEDPVYPMDKTLAAINNDLMLAIGRMKDVMVTGYGQSDLDDLVAEIAKKQDRYVYPDPNPHTGMYFRSDHFSFARKGVPSLFIRGNCDSREHGKEWAAAMEKDYIQNRYHRPADNYEPENWDFSGIVEDARMAFEIGYCLSKADQFPEWREDSEFKNIRKSNSGENTRDN